MGTAGSAAGARGAEAVSIVRPGVLGLTGDAIGARLRLVFPPERFEHAAVPAKLSVQEWKRLLRRVPFVGLGWSDLKPMRADGRLFKGTSGWTVFLVTKNSAGDRQRYWGDRQGPGLFDMVQAAVAILHGHTIPGIGTVLVTGAANGYAEGWDADEMALAQVDLIAGATLDGASTLEVPDDGLLERLGITWTFEGDGSSTAPRATDITDVRSE